MSEWQSSEPLEAVPRGRIPVPSRDIRRRIGLSGDVVDQWRVLLILRRRLVWFFAKQGKLVSSVSVTALDAAFGGGRAQQGRGEGGRWWEDDSGVGRGEREG